MISVVCGTDWMVVDMSIIGKLECNYLVVLPFAHKANDLSLGRQFSMFQYTLVTVNSQMFQRNHYRKLLDTAVTVTQS